VSLRTRQRFVQRFFTPVRQAREKVLLESCPTA
jgi:hypothetical protein